MSTTQQQIIEKVLYTTLSFGLVIAACAGYISLTKEDVKVTQRVRTAPILFHNDFKELPAPTLPNPVQSALQTPIIMTASVGSFNSFK